LNNFQFSVFPASAGSRTAGQFSKNFQLPNFQTNFIISSFVWRIGTLEIHWKLVIDYWKLKWMLIFLYGQDTFRLSRKLNQIIDEYKKRAKGLDFSVFEAASGDAKLFFTNIRQSSLFQEKKLIIVKDPISNKNFKEQLIDNLETIAASGHNFVFCQEGKILKTDRLLAALKKTAKIQEFAPLEGDKLVAWIVKEFADLGSPIDASVARECARRIGGDLWRAENEIQKLVHFITGRRISVADIDASVSLQIDANIFKTIDAVANRDKKTAIRLVKEHLSKGDHPLYLLAMIVSQFKNLLLVKAAGGVGGSARLGMHPYVFAKTLPQARRFDLGELKKIYCRIMHTDFDIKTGRINPEVGIDLLVAEL
jgi:DNA polymerase III delta subunit